LVGKGVGLRPFDELIEFSATHGIERLKDWGQNVDIPHWDVNDFFFFRKGLEKGRKSRER
jgi:hypothetical protein